MDEELMNITTEDRVEVPDPEIVETDVDIESEVQDLAATETTEVVEVEQTEEVYIDISESIGWVGGDSTKHYSMAGRDEPNQHPIEAISGLRDELNEIEALQTVFSDKVGFANYYKWLDGAYDETGYFVSIEPGTSEIKICDGENIFGVTVASAGFVGGQDGVTLDYINGVRDAQGAPRDNSYGLVVTSGFADVRCELDVQVGDCVVSNARGLAKKSASNYGYKVLAKENKDGIEYAVILLGVQADKTNAIGEEINGLTNRVKTNEQNIVSAINLANQAYNKSADSANVSEEALKKALEALLNSEYTADDMEKLQESMSSTAAIVAQARDIAESAVNSAESMRDTAVKEANEALTDTIKLREEFAGMEKQITDIDGRVVIVTQKTTENGRAISGIQSKADTESARIDLLTSWQSDTKTAMARIEQKADENGAYIKSTVSNMDKYSVGPHSQAYGFTLEQAQSVLEVGMIYAPTDSVTEDYEYKDGEETKEVSRSFTPGYLYQWGYIGWVGDGTGWKTVGESQSVIFATETPIANDSMQYWYTNGDPVSDTYEPYTLYKWTTYETKLEKEYESDEDIISIAKSSWVPVATLAGNSQNRAVSQIRQDANSIELSVTELDNKYAGTKMWVDKNGSGIQDVVTWHGNNGDSLVAFVQEAGDNFASAAQVAQIVDKEGNIKSASIVTAVTEDESSIALLADNIVLDADHINFTANDYSVLAENITLDADHINFGNSVTITNTGDDVMNVANKFIVSRDGSVRLDGNITWGTSSSPTQVVYCSAYITKPGNNTAWSSFPETSTTGWHKNFVSGSDYYGSYTYDGGATWGDPVQIVGIKGDKGDTGAKGEKGDTGEQGAKGENGKDGSDGSDASVTDVNVFNALTNNGTKFGCFTSVDGKLYINAQYIKSGTIESELTLAGKVVAQNIDATGGTIGGFNINGDSISSIDITFDGNNISSSIDTGSVLLSSVAKTKPNVGGNSGGSGWRLIIGPNFGVTGSGKLYASGAQIDGKITATSGYIGSETEGFEIDTNRIYNKKTSYSNTTEGVYIGTDGIGLGAGTFYVTSAGYLFAQNGKIGGNTFDSSGIHITNGTIKMPCGDGKQVELGTTGGLRVVNTLAAMFTGKYSCAQYSADVLRYGYSTSLNGSITNTNWFAYDFDTANPYVMVVGTWNGNSSVSIASDANMKNSIETLDDRYEIMFDGLTPRRFHYNDGTSGRYHTGYIAQEVQLAIETSDLSEKDFAALCTFRRGEENEFMGLRYEEFVSLNTWQIQKLKARVAELEAKIATLT